METSLDNSESDAWIKIAPLLDTALEHLGEKDHDAIVLRYLERKDLKEVGAAMGIGEDAAKMRVHRALEKLRRFFVKRGVASTTAIIAGAVAAHSVHAAPIALAPSISTIAMTKGALATNSIPTLIKGALKTMAWTKTKTAIVSAVVVAGLVAPLVIQNQRQTKLQEDLRRQSDQLAKLQSENRFLSDQLAMRTSKPRLPAPRMSTVAAQTQPLDEFTNLISRIQNGEEVPKLTQEQIDTYLKENQRNAASLVTGFRATGNQALLREAMEKFPNDPLVNFAAIFDKGLSQEERREQLNALKHSARENALGYFLSALDYFKSGQTDQAVQELSAAYGKTQFQDFTKDLIQNSEEAYLAAGFPVAEAKALANSQVSLPHLAELKQLSANMIELANSYRQKGDEASAQAALQIASNLGQRFNGAPGEPLISQLVGLAIQQNALRAMNPNAPFGTEGQTVSDRLQQVAQQNEQLRTLARQMDSMQNQMTPEDWINYIDRWRSFGEHAATQWLVDKYRK